eukprot:3434317-Prymnesium_polylepis.1
MRVSVSVEAATAVWFVATWRGGEERESTDSWCGRIGTGIPVRFVMILHTWGWGWTWRTSPGKTEWTIKPSWRQRTWSSRRWVQI